MPRPRSEQKRGGLLLFCRDTPTLKLQRGLAPTAAMAAAISFNQSPYRQYLTVPQTGDRLKTIEAKVVIIGAQGKVAT